MGRKTLEDWELWERVKKTTVPRHPSARAKDFGALIEESGTVRKAKSEPRPGRIVRPAVPEPAFRVNLAPEPVLLDDSVSRKIAKGKLAIDGRIDLHGMTQEGAYSRLYRFIDQSFREQKRTILVITGKGKLGEGILRQAVPRWLVEPGFSDKVIGYREAHSAHGGGGALYVRLRNRNRKGGK